jgi:hypothetical protein
LVLLDRINDALYVGSRGAASREASSIAAIIESQSATSAGKGACIDPTRFDATRRSKVRGGT